jgi:hypothetical protein
MNRRFPKYFTLLALTVLFVSCDSSDSTGPDDTTQSSLSFILNGMPYSNTAVELRDNGRGIWLTASTGRLMAVLDGIGSFGGTTSRRIVATITIPENTPGPQSWIDPKGAVLSFSGVFLDIYEQSGSATSYQAVQGSTTLSIVGGVGEQIDGSFSGSLRSTSDGSIITISSGAFSLTRLADQ